MSEKLNNFYKIVEQVFIAKGFTFKREDKKYKLARCAFFWLCKNFTDMKYSKIAEQSSVDSKTVYDAVKLSDKLYWKSPLFCKNITKCVSLLPRYVAKPLKELEPIVSDDIVIMPQISRLYRTKSAILLQYIYNLTKFDRITIKMTELIKYAKKLKPHQVYSTYYRLINNGVINDTSKKYGYLSIKIIDEKLIKSIEYKPKKPRKKKDFRATLPEFVMEHVLALEEIRKNKKKKIQ